MSTRKSELTRQAARLFAEKGYHGTSIGDLAEAMGVQKGSLYAHIDSKADLLWDGRPRRGRRLPRRRSTPSPTSCRRPRRSGSRCARIYA